MRERPLNIESSTDEEEKQQEKHDSIQDTMLVISETEGLAGVEQKNKTMVDSHPPPTPEASGPSNVNNEDGDNDDDDEARLWRELKTKSFKFGAHGGQGNPLAGRFQRAKSNDAQMAKDYASMKGNTAKEKFRAEWAKGEYQRYLETKTFKQTHTQECKNAGTWYSLQRIAVEEGGGKEGMTAAINYCLSCLAQPTPTDWCEYNSWTKTLKFRFVVKHVDDSFTQQWSSEQSWSKTINKAEASTASSKRAIEDSGDQANKQRRAGNKQQAAPSPRGEPKSTKDDSGKKASFNIAQARKTKTNYNATVSSADLLLRNIELDPAWKWFNNAAATRDLKEALVSLKDIVDHDAFLKQALSLDYGDLKKDCWRRGLRGRHRDDGDEA